MNDFKNKELVNTYSKNGFIVKIYKPVMSEKERKIKDTQIKYEILNIIKDFKKNITPWNKLGL